MAAQLTARHSWPWGPAEGHYPDDDHTPPDQALPDERLARDVIGEMTRLPGGTREGMLVALSELRRKTGAPLDPRARWLTLPLADTDPEEWTWTRAHLWPGAACPTRHRIQRADTWTYAAAACFMTWTAAAYLGR